MAEVADRRFTVRLNTATANNSNYYASTGYSSRPITWISSEPAPVDVTAIHHRVEALRDGETQWGHAGAHHGRQGDEECPMFLHHHHDWRCAMPTEDECRMAGVPYRTTWASRG